MKMHTMSGSEAHNSAHSIKKAAHNWWTYRICEFKLSVYQPVQAHQSEDIGSDLIKTSSRAATCVTNPASSAWTGTRQKKNKPNQTFIKYWSVLKWFLKTQNLIKVWLKAMGVV